MPIPSFLNETKRIDEPRAVQDYSEVLTRVAMDRKAIIVRRDGADLAAVIPLEQLELMGELLARTEVETIASGIDWEKVKEFRPPQQWFEDGDNPFLPEDQTAP